MDWNGLAIPQLDGFTGFVPPEGTCSNGVALIGEAPGEMEARYGKPFYEAAPAGAVLSRLLRRAGLERESFVISNVVWSRPPGNYLDGARYEGEATRAFAPFRERLQDTYRPRVLVALGGVALRTLTSYGGQGASITKVQGYVLDGPWDGTWVIGALHPSAIMRGEQRMSGVVIWTLQRALEIARHGFVRLPERYITHPSPDDARAFEQGYCPERHFLSYDIETADSTNLDEEEVEDRDEDMSFTPTRISFCYSATDGHAISFPWQPPYIDIARRMLGSVGPKRVWNGNFDNPRLQAAGAPVRGRIYDTMWAWKHLQPTLPRSLGFVAPFYGWTGEPWKHTSDSEPERYSCADSWALHLIADGVDVHLRQKGMYNVYHRHVVEVSDVLHTMSVNGMPWSPERAAAFEQELRAKWDERFAILQTRVPDEIKPSKQKHGYKKPPVDLTGLARRVFKVLPADLTDAELEGKYSFATGSAWSPYDIVDVERWCKLEPFLPTSWQQLLALIKHYGQKAGTNRKTKKETTEDDTLRKLVKKCRASRKPREQEFAEILDMCRECRQLSKVLGTYIKGWRPGKDGRIHATPGFWGKMFRVSWRRPNISATIQDKNEEYAAGGFRKCVAVPPGRLIVESDWKGMEAVLCGYFARDEEYMRLARLGVHGYMTWLVLADSGKVLMSDVPDLSWSDADLKCAFKEIKKRFPKDADDCKHIVHGSNYLGTARYLADLYELREALVKGIQAQYFTRFYKLQKWQRDTLDRASRECKLRNPFGYEMPFWEVFRWDSKKAARDPKGNGWVLGEDAKSAVAFLPRDTGAAMLKEALLRLRPLADQGIMLASQHDAITCECNTDQLDSVVSVLRTEMERPVPELDGLSIGVEIKAGEAWHESAMEVLDLPAVPVINVAQTSAIGETHAIHI